MQIISEARYVIIVYVDERARAFVNIYMRHINLITCCSEVISVTPVVY